MGGSALINSRRSRQDNIADLYFFGRWSPVNQAPILVDCAMSRSALLIDGADFAPDGTVADADWQTMPDNDPILKLVCET